MNEIEAAYQYAAMLDRWPHLQVHMPEIAADVRTRLVAAMADATPNRRTGAEQALVRLDEATAAASENGI